jgi:FixJ family two-component response regulator
MTAPPKDIVAVVDDDTRLRHSVGRLLEAYDYSVFSFSSGPALIERQDLSAFGCVIADIGMPGMDGFELLKVVKAKVPGLPVILITGRDHPDDAALARARGSYAFFRKPFDPEALLKSVADGVRQRSIRLTNGTP